ncbi:triose-phosphate isomerase [Mycoplasmopsis gallopavonis]|uniref:Triosephosphate isomerase n=1 Tax=Mycoplasmopsis gallopavonis TaxID=76629 RepID=A0A449B045_9BACT|nr:triose-phosphate isomerase [Mycoplasmopsis gallopavonis]RIV16260.1 triose-phosphate isomerase [Mycoplasmopsis gallopavonis]VEU73133.1 Triosephosphate isomerase [Mycoplasmopsis gallopavonis]
MKNKVIIGNWKMNKTFSESVLFLQDLAACHDQNKDKIAENIKYAIAAPFTNLSAFSLNQVPHLEVAAQNMSNKEAGAYTGEIAPNMLVEMGVKYVVLGHSERREYYHESNQFVYEKAKLALEYNLIPVICVGETLEEYEAGKTKEVVKKQIEESVKDLDYTRIIVAYEPIWAIGTGKVATPEIAEEVCKYIHELTSNDLIVQYGGSVNPKNIAELSQMPNIDGFLVGGASLEAESFIKLLTLGK